MAEVTKNANLITRRILYRREELCLIKLTQGGDGSAFQQMPWKKVSQNGWERGQGANLRRSRTLPELVGRFKVWWDMTRSPSNRSAA